jgi:hypothetical protein
MPDIAPEIANNGSAHCDQVWNGLLQIKQIWTRPYVAASAWPLRHREEASGSVASSAASAFTEVACFSSACVNHSGTEPVK